MTRILLLFSALAVASVALAQNKPLACDGQMATVRISEIKPAGSASGFEQAVAAHKAWYKSHGMGGEQIFASRIVLRDETTHAASYSDKQFMTFHIHATPPGSAPGPKHDEGYDAFVKMYRDNSDIKAEYNVCMPKPVQ